MTKTTGRLGMGTAGRDGRAPSSTGPGSGSSSRTVDMPRSSPTSAATWQALSSWPGHAILQLQQDKAALRRDLVAGPLRVRRGDFACWPRSVRLHRGSRSLARDLLVTLSLPALILWFGPPFGSLIWMIGFITFGIRTATKAVLRPRGRMGRHGDPHAVLSPLCAAVAPVPGPSWLLLAGALVILRANLERLGEQGPRSSLGMRRDVVSHRSGPLVHSADARDLHALLVVGEGDLGAAASRATPSARPAVRSRAISPRTWIPLHLYARPPVTFYLSGVGAGVLPSRPSIACSSPVIRRPGPCSTRRWCDRAGRSRSDSP